MSNQSVPYYRVPTKAQPETLAAIHLVAHRTPSFRILLNHIAYLEDELSKQNRASSERRDLIGGRV